MLATSRPKYLTLGVLGAMMALLIVGLIYTQGSVRAEIGSETGAIVAPPADVAPVIECKWELPDMQALPGYNPGGVLDSTAPDGLIQYDVAGGTHQHDDDMAHGPVAYPCDTDGTNPPQQVANSKNMIQVKPLGHNDPDSAVPQRYIQLWMAVDGEPNGNVGDVYWDIYHPDNSLKVQVHGTRIGAADGDLTSPGDFQFNDATYGSGWGDSSQGKDHNNDALFNTVGETNDITRRVKECGGLSEMYEAANHTDQVSWDAINENALGLGLIYRCQQGLKQIFYAKFTITKDQPCGEYRIEAVAKSKGGKKSAAMINYIDILCFSQMNLDFSSLDWGTITGGQMSEIPGNFGWDAGGVAMANSNPPTVHNGGNHPMGIHLSFTKMALMNGSVPASPAKYIEWFDACFSKDAATLACIGRSGDVDGAGIPIDAIAADEWVAFGDPSHAVVNDKAIATWAWWTDSTNFGWEQVLCNNDVGKLDLSIHPYLGQDEGTYKGQLLLRYHAVHDTDPNECTGDQWKHTGTAPNQTHDPLPNN